MFGGYWTYHKTYDSCCCLPCCLSSMILLPIWPIICGVTVVKENLFSKPKQECSVEMNDEVNTDKESFVIHED